MRRILPALFAIVASATAAPSLRPPPIDAPVRYKNATVAAAPRASAAGDAWWNVFRDPALDRLERSATGDNQDLRQAVARIDEARQQTRSAASGFYPTVESNLSFERVRTTNSNPIGHAQLIGNASPFAALIGGSEDSSGAAPAFASRGLTATFNDIRTPLTVSYELDIFGRIRHSYAGAQAIGQAAEADRQAVALSLGAEVARAYFQPARARLGDRGFQGRHRLATGCRATEPGKGQCRRGGPARSRPRASGTRQYRGRPRGDSFASAR